MNKQINLKIRKEKKAAEIDSKKITRLRIIAVSILVVVGILSGVLFVAVSSSPLPKLREESDSLKNRLISADAQLSKYQLIKNQISSIEKVISGRKNFGRTFDSLSSITPSSINLQTFTVSPNDLLLSYTGTSVTDIENFFDSLEFASNRGEIFKNIKMSAIELDQTTSTYKFSLLIN